MRITSLENGVYPLFKNGDIFVLIHYLFPSDLIWKKAVANVLIQKNIVIYDLLFSYAACS